MKLTFLLKRFPFIALLAAAVVIGGVLLPALAGAAQGTLRIDSAQAGVGQSADIMLSARDVGAPGIGAWTIDVSYDPATLSVVECRAEHGGICNPQFKSNAARITGSAAQGLTGEFVLGSLWFTCKGEGESGLELDIKVLADGTLGDPQPVEPEVRHGEIYCKEKQEDELLGDADCSGEVTSLDASWILQYSAEMVDAVPCPELADVNQDGYVDAVDATIVLQKVAGLIEK